MIKEEEYSEGEQKQFSTVRFESCFFKEEENIKFPILNIKRRARRDGSEDWEIYEDKSLALSVVGSKLTDKQKKILRTPTGLKILLTAYKNGAKSISSIMEILDNLNDNI